MSRRVGNIPEETRAGLIRAAADEFAEYGFEKSSLRRICARAGVTTGALYASFRDKEDLFENVISPVIGHICSTLGEHFKREKDSSAEELLNARGEEHDVQAVMAILRYYFNNRKLCSILFENREHPAVKEFFDRVIEMTDRQTAQDAGVIGQKAGGAEKHEFGENTVHWFSHLQVDMIFYIIEHDMDECQAERQVRGMIRFFRGGLYALIDDGFLQNMTMPERSGTVNDMEKDIPDDTVK